MRRPVAVALFFFVVVVSLPAQWQSIGRLDSVAVVDSAAWALFCGSDVVSLSVVAPDLVHVRYHRADAGPDRSHALIPRERQRPRVLLEREQTHLRLHTGIVQVHIQSDTLRITFLDASGRVLNADDPRRGAARDRDAVRVWKTMPPDEQYFGFGGKAGRLNKRDAHMTMWNSDIPGYAADTDPLYQSIPFFLGVREGRAYGIYFDNSYRSSFDMGKEDRSRYSFGAEGGDLSYYFFAGPEPRAVVERFTELVGRMPLPPLWSLGYQQCRWSYSPESRVREIARTFRDKKIPADVIYLDIDYMEGYRIFTWSRKNFPDPRGLVSDLSADGFKVAVIVDPGIKQDTAYEAYRTGLAGDHFLRRPDGSVYIGKVWPGECAFPDFSREATRRWWGDQFQELIDVGVRGWWNDMNEPSVFDVPTKTIDLDVVHFDDGFRTPHARNHNLYGLQMTQATYEGVRRLLPAERPFVLTRASFAGGHRYSAAWTGDNVASWEHLRMAVPMCLNLSVSGQPFVGSDIGGFIDSPDGELYARWLQLGVFTPLMRTHTVINSADQEPWSFGEDFESINRKTIELRYRLLPYLYTAMELASRTGVPPMRPLIFDDPADIRAANTETEFFFGEALMVAPVLRPGERRRSLRLPRGEWCDFLTGDLYRGDAWVTVDAPLERIPVFVKSGSVIPLQSVVQYIGAVPFPGLTMRVYPGDAGEGSLYEDDGLSFAYEQGVFLRREFRKRREGESVVLSVHPVGGSYRPERSTMDAEFLGWSSAPSGVRVNGTLLPRSSGRELREGEEGWIFVPDLKVVRVRVRESANSVEIRLTPQAVR